MHRKGCLVEEKQIGTLSDVNDYVIHLVTNKII